MLMQPEVNKIGKPSSLKLAGGIFCPFFSRSPLGWFYQRSILHSIPLCVSISTDALSSEREGLLSHQLTELGKEVVFCWMEVLEAGPTLCVSPKEFALALGAKLAAGGKFVAVT